MTPHQSVPGVAMPDHVLAALRALDAWSVSTTVHPAPEPGTGPVGAPAAGCSPPPAPPIVLGRDALLGRLRQAGDRAAAGAAPVVVLHGPAGIGKTTAATHWSAQEATTAAFPDGVLYADLGHDGLAPEQTAAITAHQWLHALGATPEEIDSACGPAAQAGLLERCLGGRRMVLILDDVASAAQIRPLLARARHCLIVVTARTPLHLEQARSQHTIEVGPLDEITSRTLLEQWAGPALVHAEPEAVPALVRAARGNPWALQLIARALAGAPVRPLASAAQALAAAASQKPVAVAGFPPEVQAAVTLADAWLPAHLDRYTLLSGFPGWLLTAEVAAIACVLDTVPDGAALLRGLAARGMLNSLGPHGYRFRTGLGQLLSKVTARRLTPLWRTQLAVLAQFCAHAVQACSLIPGGLAAFPPPHARHPTAPPADGFAWLEAHRRDLHAALGHAIAIREPQIAWQLAAALTVLCVHRGGVHEVLPRLRQALTSPARYRPIQRWRLQVLHDLAQMCRRCPCPRQDPDLLDRVLGEISTADQVRPRDLIALAALAETLLVGLRPRRLEPADADSLCALVLHLAERVRGLTRFGMLPRLPWLLGLATASSDPPTSTRRALEMITAYEQALRSRECWVEAAPVAVSAAVLLAHQGELAEAEAVLDRAVTSLPAGRAPEPEAAVAAALGLVRLARGENDQGRTGLRTALARLAGRGNSPAELLALLHNLASDDTAHRHPAHRGRA